MVVVLVLVIAYLLLVALFARFVIVGRGVSHKSWIFAIDMESQLFSTFVLRKKFFILSEGFYLSVAEVGSLGGSRREHMACYMHLT